MDEQRGFAPSRLAGEGGREAAGWGVAPARGRGVEEAAGAPAIIDLP